MRKIVSEEEKARSEQKKKTAISIVLAMILLLSTLGYFISDFSGTSEEKIIYNNVEFERDDSGYWHFTLLGKEHITLTNPYDVENISINTKKALGDYNNKPLYFESMSSQFGIYEITRNIGDAAERVNLACLDENCSEYAIKNCSIDNIIIINLAEGNDSIIRDEENCVYIEYAPGENEKAVDAFLFRVLGLK